MTNIKELHLYHLNWFWATTDHKEVPTYIKQIMFTTQDRIDLIMDNPWLVEKDYPAIAKNIKDRQESYERVVSMFLWSDDSCMTNLDLFNEE